MKQYFDIIPPEEEIKIVETNDVHIPIKKNMFASKKVVKQVSNQNEIEIKKIKKEAIKKKKIFKKVVAKKQKEEVETKIKEKIQETIEVPQIKVKNPYHKGFNKK